MRPMFVEFPEDPPAWTVDTQYMLGPNILVAPIFNEEGAVQFYVPEGRWYGILDGKSRTGPGFFTETHDFMSLPILLRPDSAIALCSRLREGPVYDYAEDLMILANLQGKEDTELVLDIPNSDQPGVMQARIEVVGSSLRVIEGEIKGKCELKKV